VRPEGHGPSPPPAADAAADDDDDASGRCDDHHPHAPAMHTTMLSSRYTSTTGGNIYENK